MTDTVTISEIKPILFGKTADVILADGKTYVLREPTLAALESNDISLDKIGDAKHLRTLLTIMLMRDHGGLTKELVGDLVTFSMLKDGSPLMAAILSVLGVKDDSAKNG